MHFFEVSGRVRGMRPACFWSCGGNKGCSFCCDGRRIVGPGGAAVRAGGLRRGEIEGC